MKKLCYSFAGLLLLVLCLQLPAFAQVGETPAADIPAAKKMITGSWQWTETRRASRGTKPVTQTPETSNRSLNLTFKTDETVEVYLNTKLAGTYKYTLNQRENDYIMISFSGTDDGNPHYQYLEEGPLTLTKSQLYIAGGYNDAGANQTFKKIAAAKPKAAKKTARKKLTK